MERTIRFMNNSHRQRSKLKYWKIILVSGSKKTKGLILPMPRGSKKMKNKNTTLSEQVHNSTEKVVERGKIPPPPNTQMHDRSFS